MGSSENGSPQEIIPKRVPGNHSLSGQKILDSLVNIADEADMRFSPDMLHRFWQPFAGNFARFVGDIAIDLGLNERIPFLVHEPIWGYANTQRGFKQSFTPLFPYLTMVNQKQLDSLSPEDTLRWTAYHIWYSVGDSSAYYEAKYTPIWKQAVNRLRGIRSEEAVKKEITDILEPLGGKASALASLEGQQREVFHYNDRRLTLARDSVDKQHYNGGWPAIIWSTALYDEDQNPLGYVLLDRHFKPDIQETLSK